ncbi:MAG: AAA family ATPase [Acidimicrobiia bacterium]
MRIQGWRVDGYGVFSGFAVDGLDTGLTVITGPNEAGKSTLLAFIRGVLFGFPDGRSRLPQYEPVHGGKHGGALYLADAASQTWTLERFRGDKGFVLTRPDGSRGEDYELIELLGGADATFFGNVFAFGLDELNSFNLLESEAVKDRVFSAAVVGAGQSARAALAELDKRRAQLWKPRGACEIRTLANQTREQQTRLRHMQKEASTLGSEEKLVDQLFVAAQEMRKSLEANRSDQARLSGYLELWPLRNRIAECDDELAELRELGLPAGLDESVISSFERLEVSYATLQAEVDSARVAVNRSLEAGWPTPLDQEQLEESAVEIRELVGGIGVAQTHQERLEHLRTTLREENGELTGHLGRLGAEWTRDHLDQFDASLPIAAEVRRHGAALETAQHKLATASNSVDELTVRLRQLRDTQRGLEERLDAMGPVLSEGEIENRSKALRLLRTNILELGRSSVTDEPGPGPTVADVEPATGSAWAKPVLVLGIVILGLAIVLAIVDLMGLAVVAGVAGFVASLVAAFTILRSPTRNTLPVSTAKPTDSAEAIGGVAQIRTSIEAMCIVLGLPPNPSSDDIEAYADELAEAAAQQEARTAIRNELEQVKERSNSTDLELDQARALAEAARDELSSASDGWLSWKMDHQVDHKLTPNEVIDFFTILERAQASLRVVKAAEAESEDLNARFQGWQDRANRVFRRLVVEAHEPMMALEQLQYSLDELHSAKARLAQASDSRDEVEEQLQRIMAVAGVDEAELFRQSAERFRSYRALEIERDNLVERLANHVGWGDTATVALAELERGVPQLWKTELEAAKRAQPELEAAYETAIRKHQDADKALEAKLKSSEIAEASLELEGLRSGLAEAIHQWQVLSGAKTLIQETLGSYERERQPAVLRRAEAMFQQITDGHYVQLIVVDGNISVLDKDQRVVAANDLSRGTIEQLYLCLRFGLAAEMANRSPLPFILDDVLVNFDPDRVRQTAAVIAGIATEQQVFAFTCQPASVEALVNAEPNARLIELPRHGGR